MMGKKRGVGGESREGEGEKKGEIARLFCPGARGDPRIGE